MLDIKPDLIKSFSNKYRNENFCLVTTPSLDGQFTLHSSIHYKSYHQYVCNNDEKFVNLLNIMPDYSDIFFLPYQHSEVNPAALSSTIKRNQRVVIMDCDYRTPITIEDIKYFLNFMYKVDKKELRKKVSIFYNSCNSSNELIFQDSRFDTLATLIFDENCTFFDGCSDLKPGQSQIEPSGEIGFAHYNFANQSIRLSTVNLNGELLFQGYPIVHCLDQDKADYQNRVFDRLILLKETQVKVEVRHGKIVNCSPLTKDANIACSTLNSLLESDDRYCVICEIGIGLHSNLELRPYNCAMNETYGGDNMCVHFGIGAPLVTLFHLDMLCPATQIITDTGNLIMKSNPDQLKFSNASSCPCY